MNKGIAWLLTGIVAGAVAGTACLGAVSAANGWAKAETLLVPFKWIAGGNTISSADMYFNGAEWVPGSMNYKGTTYIPIRLASESLGFTLYWDKAAGTATLVDSESSEDPVSDIPGKYPSASVTLTAKVSKDITLLSSAGGQGDALGLVKAGTKVIVLEESGNEWARVLAGSRIGWLPVKATDYVPASLRPKWERTADSIIEVGLKFLGTEYEFDADLGQTDTFDCSSFVNYLYELHGMDMPRNSRQQSETGKGIAFNELRKGDLVFFTTPKREDNTGVHRIGHVGIYIGENKLLHTYRKGIGVTVTVMDENWKRRFVKAKRVIQSE